VSVAHERGVIVKVIIETALLDLNHKVQHANLPRRPVLIL